MLTPLDSKLGLRTARLIDDDDAMLARAGVRGWYMTNPPRTRLRCGQIGTVVSPALDTLMESGCTEVSGGDEG